MIIFSIHPVCSAGFIADPNLDRSKTDEQRRYLKWKIESDEACKLRFVVQIVQRDL